ncbi:ankyrin repeat protein [Penguinpox virus]|uniref:Ankyrin repeat protein n=1 Tax=Penguinpox virus TaxID=648998 RepID=A0A068EL98_9POXV|nr:ankyrin repeat protein [Penguinpox virus]AID46772.1 ankyrin repeat protein [Penguinpox virus]
MFLDNTRYEESTLQPYSTNLVRRLMEGNTKDEGIRVLRMAIKFERIDIIKILLEYDIDINEKDYYEEDLTGYSVLHLAVDTGNKEIVSILLYAGADVNNTRCYLRNTPLHLAIQQKNTDIAKMLLDYGADQNIINENHNTPIHIAVTCNDQKMINILLQYSPNLEIGDHYGRTVLHNAVLDKNVNIVSLLIENGALVDSKCREGYTILLSSINRTDPVIIKMLLYRGANPVFFNKKLNHIPLTWYCYCHGNSLSITTKDLISSAVMISHISNNIKLSPGFKINEDFTNSIYQFKNYKNLCEEEIRNMKIRRAGYKMTVFDFIKAGKRDDHNTLARCIELLLIGVNKNEFQIYGNIIDQYIKIGLNRKEQLDLAVNSLKNSIISLPYEVIYIIVEKMTNKELCDIKE